MIADTPHAAQAKGRAGGNRTDHWQATGGGRRDARRAGVARRAGDSAAAVGDWLRRPVRTGTDTSQGTGSVVRGGTP